MFKLLKFWFMELVLVVLYIGYSLLNMFGIKVKEPKIKSIADEDE